MQSEQINELAAALSKAQGQMENASKDGLNPHFRSHYATLASAWDACRKALSGNGISVIQGTQITAAGVELVTTIAHSSGQWIKSFYPIQPEKPTPQGYGSAVSYARRYSLMAMVGLAAEDDDAEAATQREKPKQVVIQQKTTPAAAKPASTASDKDPGEYLITFGKYGPKPKEGKPGRRIKDLDLDDLINYVEYIEKGGDVKGAALHFVEKAKEYIKNMGHDTALDYALNAPPGFDENERFTQ